MSGLYRAFGATWASDLPLPGFDPAEGDDAGAIPDVVVHRSPTLDARTPRCAVNGGLVYADGFRLAWRDEAVFDVRVSGPGGRARVGWRPEAGWAGEMPAAFYGTVAALTLAGLGTLPCHASAIEVGGRAVLLAGVAGAGKSTLTAMLLARGATLVADDLTVVRGGPDGGFLAARGRPGIRLHADTAASVEATERRPVPGDDRGKWLVRPAARTPRDAVPVAGVLLIGEAETMAPGERAILLGPHLFRPRWLAALPGHADRLRTMLAIAGSVPCRGLDAGAGFHRDPAAVERAWAAATALAGSDRSGVPAHAASARAAVPSSSAAG